LFFISDRHSSRRTGRYGDPVVATPKLDRLSAQFRRRFAHHSRQLAAALRPQPASLVIELAWLYDIAVVTAVLPGDCLPRIPETEENA